MAARDALYGLRTWPLGKEVVVIVNDDGADAAMVNVRLTVCDCAGLPESVTLNVSALALAVAVGVPAIAPEEAFKTRPAGKLPEAKVQE